MKKILYITFMLLFCSHVKADVVLPETAFKYFLENKYPSCFYTDVNQVVWLNTSCSEITNEDSLDLSSITTGFVDLEGIQYFTSLKYLNCIYTGVVTSPPLPASLIKLVFIGALNDQPYGSFPTNFLPNGLRYLDMSSNSMVAPPSWPDSLRYLNCSHNSIGNNNGNPPMPAFPPYLDTLICTSQEIYSGNTNILTALPGLPATLKYLDCSNNSLYSLPVLPASLKYLDCSQQNYNTNPENFELSLSALPSLPDGLDTLICYFNRLTTLPALPSSLRYLDCNRCRLFYDDTHPSSSDTSLVYEGIDLLPPLPPSLQYLNCSYNKLTVLPVLPPALIYLNCSYNIFPGFSSFYNQNPMPPGGITSLQPLPSQLATLNVDGTLITCLPRLPASLTSLVINGSMIHCLPNSGNYIVTGTYVYSGYPLPLCNIFNNPDGCQYTGIISGNIFYDNNSNGIKDPNENYRPNVEVQLSNGEHGYTSDSGYYALSADPGNYTVNIVAPNLYAANPASINYSLSSFDTIVHNIIALQPAVMIDSMAVSLVSWDLVRPGHLTSYFITYTNVGSTVVSPSIQLNYDNTRLTYSESSNPGVVNNGDHINLTETNFSPGTVHHLTVTFLVSPSATSGDILYANTIVTAGTCTAKDSVQQIIASSFDPNDKMATPSLTPQQVATGTYINYVVRFQNTGTAPASRIVITDTLSSFLDAATFKMVDASHTCITTRVGNKIIFEFSNITLPDSTLNEPGSHGFIRFAVKPFTNVSLNTVIPNKASIYFDFNQPVVTNIANTTIQLTTVPLTLLSFKALPAADNMAFLYWNTANEFNTMSFEIEQSMDSRIFTGIGSTTARGRGDNTYSYNTIIPADIVYYRLKMIDIDGRFTYSQVIQVKRNKQSASITVLSNPTKNILSIINTDKNLVNTTATIVNEQGIVVKRFVLNDGLQNIDVSNLSTSVYYLKTMATTNKIIINH